MIILGSLAMVCLVASTVLFFFLKNGKISLSNKRKESEFTDGYQMFERGTASKQHILADSPILTDEYSDIVERYCVFMNTEKPYKNPDIRISDVASRLGISKSTLSRAIRMKTGKNFCQLVHSYRVKEAMRLYAGNTKLSITQLCKMVGFNSATTFNTAFGRNTGLTPAEWCKNFKKQHLDETYETKKRN